MSARETVLAAAGRLVGEGGEALRALPVAGAAGPEGWGWIVLPDWACDLVPDDAPGLFSPIWGGVTDWERHDWWRAAEALLSCRAERAWEAAHGPLHSYAFRLPRAMRPAFDRAWVNRMILFLRRWSAQIAGIPEAATFPEPRAIVHLTHDVDAVAKTPAIRVKQAVFSLWNRKPLRAARFLFGPADYWQFGTILEMERRYGRTSLWNLYGGRGGWLRPPKEILMDPAYQVRAPRLAAQFRAMREEGHRIGLHPRFSTWADADRMRAEKRAIEAAIGAGVTEVRQHWLRFSFADTWRAQRAAGLTHDLTLGFNDRPGFRASAALSWRDETGMRVTPMVLMDSHVHDYADMDVRSREAAIDRILDELAATGGEASIIWHQRVFHPDYGWGPAYEYLLDGLTRRGIAEGTP